MGLFFKRLFAGMILLSVPVFTLLLIFFGVRFLFFFLVSYAIVLFDYILIARRSIQISSGDVRGSGFLVRFIILAFLMTLVIRLAHPVLFAIISGVLWSFLSFYIVLFVLLKGDKRWSTGR